MRLSGLCIYFCFLSPACSQSCAFQCFYSFVVMCCLYLFCLLIIVVSFIDADSIHTLEIQTLTVWYFSQIIISLSETFFEHSLYVTVSFIYILNLYLFIYNSLCLYIHFVWVYTKAGPSGPIICLYIYFKLTKRKQTGHQHIMSKKLTYGVYKNTTRQYWLLNTIFSQGLYFVQCSAF